MTRASAMVFALAAALKAAYAQLGLNVDVYDLRASVVATQEQRLLHRFNGKPLGRFFDCGYMTTGDRADRWYVYVSVRSDVSPTATGSVVSTLVTASAQDPSGGKTRLPCGTTGRLESALLDAARSTLHTGG